MASVHFAPYPGFTIATAILTAILVGLGVWQIQRLQWKLDLIATMARKMDAAPIAVDGPAGALRQVPQNEYARVSLSGHFDNSKEAYVFTTDPALGAVYHVLTPFETDAGQTYLVDRGMVPAEKRDPSSRAKGQISGETHLIGIWRTPDAPGLFTPAPDLAHRIWYARDLEAIAAADHIQVTVPVGDRRGRCRAQYGRLAQGRADGGRFAQQSSLLCHHLVWACRGFDRRLSRLSYVQGPAELDLTEKNVSGRSQPVPYPHEARRRKPVLPRSCWRDWRRMAGSICPGMAWPRFSAAEIASFKGRRYQDVAFEILSRFVGDSFSAAELREDIEAAYAGFEHPQIAPLVPMSGNRYLLELFHGPTFAFKDIALQILGRLFARALRRRGGRATVVAATSGDTGSAAIAALGGLPNIDVFVLHPKGRVSEIQRRQMTTSGHANVHNIALEGSFDDAQGIVKGLFVEKEFAREMNLTAVNSINFVRIAAQSVYYFTAAAQLDQPAIFVVPTGNFGDIFAGEAWPGAHVGLAARKLVIATFQCQRHHGPARLERRRLCPRDGASYPEPLDGHPGGVEFRTRFIRSFGTRSGLDSRRDGKLHKGQALGVATPDPVGAACAL